MFNPPSHPIIIEKREHMKLYRWKTLGDYDPEQCFLDAAPKGLGARSAHLSHGKPVTALYPEDPCVQLSEENPGIRLESFIGNTKRMLVVSSPLRAVLEKWCQEQDIEYLPVHIYNHRGRLHTSDYSIINPLGTLDCLDRERSHVEMMKDVVLSVERIVLSPAKLERAPHLFRVREDPSVYVVSESLAEALRAGAFTNVVLEPMEVAPA
ncbi:imm11 family protein [Archangium sp.]|uniref:imm11 family protein n=1 Tax=Archangium sp. TaxID=1872627 RepID=UPI002D6C978E|nr:DUF1629 domain-containing protein [Archangium sp.]HYO55246.1 DUF1629 domain-containing protein [Archangium sp.]